MILFLSFFPSYINSSSLRTYHIFRDDNSFFLYNEKPEDRFKKFTMSIDFEGEMRKGVLYKTMFAETELRNYCGDFNVTSDMIFVLEKELKDGTNCLAIYTNKKDEWNYSLYTSNNPGTNEKGVLIRNEGFLVKRIKDDEQSEVNEGYDIVREEKPHTKVTSTSEKLNKENQKKNSVRNAQVISMDEKNTINMRLLSGIKDDVDNKVNKLYSANKGNVIANDTDEDIKINQNSSVNFLQPPKSNKPTFELKSRMSDKAKGIIKDYYQKKELENNNMDFLKPPQKKDNQIPQESYMSEKVKEKLRNGVYNRSKNNQNNNYLQIPSEKEFVPDNLIEQRMNQKIKEKLKDIISKKNERILTKELKSNKTEKTKKDDNSEVTIQNFEENKLLNFEENHMDDDFKKLDRKISIDNEDKSSTYNKEQAQRMYERMQNENDYFKPSENQKLIKDEQNNKTVNTIEYLFYCDPKSPSQKALYFPSESKIVFEIRSESGCIVEFEFLNLLKENSLITGFVFMLLGLGMAFIGRKFFKHMMIVFVPLIVCIIGFYMYISFVENNSHTLYKILTLVGLLVFIILLVVLIVWFNFIIYFLIAFATSFQLSIILKSMLQESIPFFTKTHSELVLCVGLMVIFSIIYFIAQDYFLILSTAVMGSLFCVIAMHYWGLVAYDFLFDTQINKDFDFDEMEAESKLAVILFFAIAILGTIVQIILHRYEVKAAENEKEHNKDRDDDNIKNVDESPKNKQALRIEMDNI